MFTEHQTLLFEGTDFYFRHSVDSLHSSVVKVLRVLFCAPFPAHKSNCTKSWGSCQGKLRGFRRDFVAKIVNSVNALPVGERLVRTRRERGKKKRPGRCPTSYENGVSRYATLVSSDVQLGQRVAPAGIVERQNGHSLLLISAAVGVLILL